MAFTAISFDKEKCQILTAKQRNIKMQYILTDKGIVKRHYALRIFQIRSFSKGLLFAHLSQHFKN